MNIYVIAMVCLVLCVSCSQRPTRPNPEDIEGMNVTSIVGEADHGYSLEELWLMKKRGKISMAGSGAANNGIYEYQEGMTLKDFIALVGGDSKCTSGSQISVKRVLEDNFFALGEVALDGKVEPGDTVYLNCIGN